MNRQSHVVLRYVVDVVMDRAAYDEDHDTDATRLIASEVRSNLESLRFVQVVSVRPRVLASGDVVKP
jgi:hypothetical protein